ncbi:MAG: UbiA family prenyltransferase [Deltaproteobacteria bacterium]|nr:UbiA family prenyltransferase [Deltaproteobacteria bacterium]
MTDAAGDVPTREAMRPLCVDLDGTLVKTDTLLECFVRLLKHHPLQILLVPLWLWRGKAQLKRELATRANLDVARLPYHSELLEFLRAERAAGRKLVLASAADVSIVRRVADHLALFEEVLASDGTVNLKGTRKRVALQERFRSHGYDYAGNDASDLTIWDDAHSAILVNTSPRVSRRLKAPIGRAFPGERVSARMLLEAMRIQHWVKNLLVFVPLAMAHQVQNPELVLSSVLAFLSFGLCASGIYLINDLLDLDADRRHPTKQNRPLASGALSLRLGMMMAPIALIASLAIAALLPPAFVATLTLYVVVTLAYSLRLKYIAILDVVVLAGLYAIRVLAGSAATGVPPSPWLLAFSLFFFFSLALVKRFSELDTLRRDADGTKATRGYYASDREQVASLGSASGYIAVLVLALYINSEAVVALYRQPTVLWLICPLLLYWISRIWLLAHRGQIHEDPVVFALRDRVSYVVGACVVVVLFVATTGLVGQWIRFSAGSDRISPIVAPQR